MNDRLKCALLPCAFAIRPFTIYIFFFSTLHFFTIHVFNSSFLLFFISVTFYTHSVHSKISSNVLKLILDKTPIIFSRVQVLAPLIPCLIPYVAATGPATLPSDIDFGTDGLVS